ncbi:MAG: response regulator, partial [Thermoleophilia bacterium]|nr:response regulator [Thermoleophilia bacterium]
EEALSTVGEGAPVVDLLLTDVIMPGKSGPELATQLRETIPNLAVIYMSGYAHDALVSAGSKSTDFVFIQKPFTAAELLAQVQAALEQANQAYEARSHTIQE